MTNVFVHEPFYAFERILQEAFASRYVERASPRHNDAVVRPIKPRQVPRAVPCTEHSNNSNFRLDLHENTEKNLITASFDFPGVSKEDIQIDVANGKLTVSTETKQSTEHSEGEYTMRERRFGKFLRTLQLPQGIKVIHRTYSQVMPVALTINPKDDEINATMENGVLTITFPKAAPELAPKRIGVA
jgi:HSP20 family protein